MGSAWLANTMGTVLVACRAGSTIVESTGRRGVASLPRRQRSAQRRSPGCRSKGDQFGGISAIAVVIARPPAIVEGPAQFLQPLQEGRVAGLSHRIIRGENREHADPLHALRLL